MAPMARHGGNRKMNHADNNARKRLGKQKGFETGTETCKAIGQEVIRPDGSQLA